MEGGREATVRNNEEFMTLLYCVGGDWCMRFISNGLSLKVVTKVLVL